jgi:acetolactate decarboxylase
MRLFKVTGLVLLVLSMQVPTWVLGAEGTAELYQVSTLDTLLTGDYTGSVPVKTLLEHGDTGIGTFQDLDGEMVMLEHAVYQIKSDGKVYAVAPEARVPYAMVGRFTPTVSISVTEPLSEKQVGELLEAKLPKATHYFLVKIVGEFSRVKARSVPRQEQPYPPLETVIPKQSVFEFNGISGTLVGWRSPQFLKSVSGAGNHFHFMNKAKTAGGHALEYVVSKGVIDVQELSELHLVLPERGKVYAPVAAEGPKQP